MSELALTVDDLPLGGPFAGTSPHNWLTVQQHHAWDGDGEFSMLGVRWMRDQFRVVCRSHGQVVARVSRCECLEHGSGRWFDADVLEGMLALPRSGADREERRDALRYHLDLVRARGGPLPGGINRGRVSRSTSLEMWSVRTSYTTILNHPSNPPLLPLACPRCGHLEVQTDVLRRALSTSGSRDHPPRLGAVRLVWPKSKSAGQ